MDFYPPKYYQVKQTILESIQTGELKPGDAVPSERELMAAHSVSRITVRKAVEELEQEGFLHKVQGKGTFVREEKKKQNLFSLTSCTEDILRQGMTPSRKVVDSSIIPADVERQHRLQLGPGDTLFRLCRVYYADREPINYTRTYLPYKYFPNIETHNFEEGSLYQTIENEYGVVIRKAERTFEAVLAGAEVAEQLHIHAGSPLILFRCVTYGTVQGKDVPIETFLCYYRTDIFKFSINQVR